MAGSSVAAWVSVESMADATGVFGTQSLGNVAVGSDVACGDAMDKSVDLLEEVHFFLAKPSMALRISIGVTKTTVLLWSLLMSLIELSVLR